MQIIKVNPENPEEEALNKVVKALIEDKVIAFPTDTVYGLGADIFDEKAVTKIFQIKGRPLKKGLIAMIGSLEQLNFVAQQPSRSALALVKRFWPGALTLIMKSSSSLPTVVQVNGTIGVRWPNHLLAQKIIQKASFPLATTSANISGQPPALTAEQTIDQLNGLVDLVVDGGPASGGTASTVVDVTVDPPVLVREGPLSWSEIKEVLFLA